MANNVFSNQTIKHENPEQIKILAQLLDGPVNELASFLADREITDDELDRNIMCEVFGAKWIQIEEVEETDSNEIILMSTTAWSHPIEFWEHLEMKGFSIDANYEDEMPNFFGQYSTEDGDDYVDTSDMYEAIDDCVESFDSDIKETSDYNNAMYEECVDAAVEAVGECSDFNRETIERLVENYLDFQDHYVGE